MQAGRDDLRAILERGVEGAPGSARRLPFLEGRATPASRTRRRSRAPGEIRLESPDRANGWFTTRSESDVDVHERTAAVYLRADPTGMGILDGGEAQARADLLGRRLAEWRAISNT
jgi:hypothetical protein